MNAFERHIAARVLGIHAAIILVVLMVSGLRGCFRPKPKLEIVTFIEFGSPAPQVDTKEVSKMPDPEPPAPEPEPTPAPVPEPIPEPVKPKPKPKPVKKPVEKPKPKEPEKPKWKPVDPKDIKIGKKTTVEPSKPTVSAQDIKKALQGISKPGPVGNPNETAAYDAHIYSVFYNAWNQPGSPASRPAEVTVSIQANGRIIKKKLSRSSGDSQFDQTVMTAVNSVTIFPKKPPKGYPLDNIVVQFRIID